MMTNDGILRVEESSDRQAKDDGYLPCYYFNDKTLRANLQPFMTYKTDSKGKRVPNKGAYGESYYDKANGHWAFRHVVKDKDGNRSYVGDFFMVKESQLNWEAS